jgi:predicted Zn finger-like uncharacterized protein
MNKQSSNIYENIRYYRNNIQLGHPRMGFNWNWEDSFICPKCKTYLFVSWDELSADVDELLCPKCKHNFLITCSLNEFPTEILIGAPYPGFNIAMENIFRCPRCLNYLKEKESKLPKEGRCSHCNSTWKFYPNELREDMEKSKIILR